MAIKVFTTTDSDYGRWIKMLLVGPPGSGKTLLSSTFPGTLFACTEPGLMSIADRGVRAATVKSSDDLEELLHMLEQPRDQRSDLLGVDDPIDTVVLDTIDELQDIYIRERMKDEGIEALRLQDYGWLGGKTKSILRRYRNLDMHVVMTCHEKKSQDDEHNRLIYDNNLVGAAGEWVAGAVDLSVCLKADARPTIVGDTTEIVIHRKLQTYPDSQRSWIKDRSGKLPTEIPVDFKDDYARLAEHIYGGIVTKPKKTAKPKSGAEGEIAVAPPEPISEYQHTCSVCGKGVPDAQAALAKLRFRTPLCDEDFEARVNQQQAEKEKVTNG